MKLSWIVTLWFWLKRPGPEVLAADIGRLGFSRKSTACTDEDEPLSHGTPEK